MNWFSTIGLSLDIIGVILLFIYGLPSKIETFGLSFDPSKDALKKAAKKYQKIKIGAYTGLSFILLGFVLQLIGNNPDWCSYLSR